MFKFIFVTLALVIVAIAAIAADRTADVVKMTLRALDTAESVDNDLGDDVTDETLLYKYSEGTLEENINVAVKSAILDKYGQAVRNKVSNQKTDVPQVSRSIADKSIRTTKYPRTSSSTRPTTESPTSVSNKTVKSVTRTTAKPVAKVVKSPSYEDSDTITHFVSHLNTDGTYGFDFKQSSGLEFKEMGQGGVYAEGSYQYISPEGEHISVTYTADENGYHPESDSIPTPPPVPEYILKALEYIREHPTAEELADREVRAKQI